MQLYFFIQFKMDVNAVSIPLAGLGKGIPNSDSKLKQKANPKKREKTRVSFQYLRQISPGTSKITIPAKSKSNIMIFIFTNPFLLLFAIGISFGQFSDFNHQKGN